MKGLSILGSTGSISRNCLQVIKDFSSDFRVVSLEAGNNIGLLAEQIQKFQPAIVSVSKDSFISPLLYQLRRLSVQPRPSVVSGLNGLIEIATHSESSLIVSAIVSITGLLPTFEAIQ